MACSRKPSHLPRLHQARPYVFAVLHETLQGVRVSGSVHTTEEQGIVTFLFVDVTGAAGVRNAPPKVCHSERPGTKCRGVEESVLLWECGRGCGSFESLRSLRMTVDARIPHLSGGMHQSLPLKGKPLRTPKGRPYDVAGSTGNSQLSTLN